MNNLEQNLKNEEKTGLIKIEEKKKCKKRELIWDIVKGIGIASIVIGHVMPSRIICRFVYMYHLAIFYFVSAYFYNEKKYGNKPFEYFAHRLKSVWSKYVFYSVLIILCHNFFIKYNFYSPSTSTYTILNMVQSILNCTILQYARYFLGALWFVPTLLIALGLFAGIIYVSIKLSKIISLKMYLSNEKYIKYICILLISIIFAMIGVYLNKNKLQLGFHAHTSFLAVPICMFGYFFKKNIGRIKRLKKFYIVVPILILSSFFLLYMIIKKQLYIELSDEIIANGFMFYIISFVGICFCISSASIIEKVPFVNKIVAGFGKHSFAIMALHFACIKGVDVIYSKIIGEINPEIISRGVKAYPNQLWLIYIVVGCMVPCIFSIVIDFIKNILKNKLGISEENY